MPCLERRSAEVAPDLGVDEKSIRKEHRRVTVMTNLEGKRILEMTLERTQASLVNALLHLDAFGRLVGINGYAAALPTDC
jgi:uncharacterized protein YeeX (DUF496 family)